MHTDKGKPVITVSYPVQKYLVESITGDDYDINTLIEPGINPENFDPSISTIISVQNSIAYLSTGTPGFEETIINKIKSNNSDIDIIDTSKGILRIRGTHRGLGKHDGDPHIFSSIKNMKKMASNIYSEMIQLNPSHKKVYEANYNRLKKTLNQLDDSVSSILSKCKGKSFIIMHPSLSYFARDYGLSQIAVETDGKEVTPKQLEERINLAVKNEAGIIFYETESAPAPARLISDRLGIDLMKFTLTGENWSEQIQNIAHAIAKGCNN